MDGRELAVQASLPPGASTLRLGEGAERFVRALEVWRAGEWHAAGAWPRCGEGCTLRYRFLLSEAARASDADFAEAFGGAYVAPASTWAVRSNDGMARDVRFHFRGPGASLSGAPPVADGSDASFVSRHTNLADAPFSAFGSWHVRTVHVGEQTLLVGIAEVARALDDDGLVEWIRASAAPLAAYFGRLAAERPLVLIVPSDEPGIDGRTLGAGGASVLLKVDRSVTAETARASWVATHEFIHANLPSFGHPHEWFEEGVATYIEPVARVRAGTLRADALWRDLLENLPKGLPQPGDRGLEGTHTWARTYWGGALFCLMADVAIRERTRGRRSLDDALRAIAGMGPGVAVQVDLARALALGDAATETHVLGELYPRFAAAPETFDLGTLWGALGLMLGEDRVVHYDDGASLAWVRRGIATR